MTDDSRVFGGGTMLGDLVASLDAVADQLDAAIRDALGVKSLPHDWRLLVSPDVGLRLTRNGVIPDRVRITWYLPERTAYVIDGRILDRRFNW